MQQGTAPGPKPTTTRTLGRLHFEDLDPHRFEDLVRQLAYHFKAWEQLEAIGGSGDDGGVDIRGVEAAVPSGDSDTSTDDTSMQEARALPDPRQGGPEQATPGSAAAAPHSDENNEDRYAAATPTRTWLIQVKREAAFGPANARSVIAAARFDDNIPPVGFIVAVAANVSRTTRRELANGLHDRGIAHVVVWGRGELEDMLFDPANDHLLFAYFGISLRIRKRALATTLRAQHATKRQTFRAFGGLDSKAAVPVLLRDPDATEYPDTAAVPQWDPLNPPWIWTSFQRHDNPNGVVLTYRRHHAWWTEDDTYDVIDTCSHPFGDGHRHRRGPYGTSPDVIFGEAPHANETDHGTGRGPQRRPLDDSCARAKRYVDRNVPEHEQAWVVHRGLVLWDDILLVDDLGDATNGPPHLLVARNQAHGFFARTETVIEHNPRHRPASLEPPRQHRIKDVHQLTRTLKFPATLPPVASRATPRTV